MPLYWRWLHSISNVDQSSPSHPSCWQSRSFCLYIPFPASAVLTSSEDPGGWAITYLVIMTGVRTNFPHLSGIYFHCFLTLPHFTLNPDSPLQSIVNLDSQAQVSTPTKGTLQNTNKCKNSPSNSHCVQRSWGITALQDITEPYKHEGREVTRPGSLYMKNFRQSLCSFSRLQTQK